MTVRKDNSKEAITHLKVLKRYKGYTLVSLILETGRTHQIRVHMNYIGHPIVNDPVYGRRKILDQEFGQMLHSESIKFIHPVTKKELSFKTEPPEEFKNILDKIKSM